jgi:multiple sugar transport system ATP-binding protein
VRVAEIRLEGITKVYGRKVRAVDRVDLAVAPGEFMVLLGPSGCGKTTLLRAVAGLEHPEEGRVVIGGRDVTDLPPRKRRVAMVFQSYAVFPHMKVFDNVAFGLRMERGDRTEIQGKVERAAALLELSDLLDRYPSQLSGGQRQRVAVARAIVMDPEVLLMDEPLSNLDALLRLRFRAELKRLVTELGTTTLYVTHDQVEALSLGDRIAVMREGRILQSGTPAEVYEKPVTQFVGGFVGTPPMNFLAGRLEFADGRARIAVEGHLLPAPPGTVGDGQVLVGVRAENIDASAEPVADGLEVTAEVVELLGSQLLVTAAVGGQHVKLLTRTDFPAHPGRKLWLRFGPDKVRLYESPGGSQYRP